ncbi:MAG: hydantoinase B/oxoprolinase family protein [Thermoleophilia bacterium]
MGGTSTDVSLCLDGEPAITRETRLGAFPLKAPTVDVRSVGAGGGSLAHVPEVTRALRVGPESAGAVPGPAAYGRGGEGATVTDANLVLGYLPARLLGGAMALDVELARAAVGRVADALGLSVEEAAEGIVDVVNESMVGALRLVSVEKGLDPRDFALVAFGGAGPLHANALAELMGCFPVLVPPTPGVLCALGDAVSPFRGEVSETFIERLDQVTADGVAARLRALAARADDWLAGEGVPAGDREVRLEVDVRYHKQALEIPVAVDPDALDLADVAERFAARHEREYGFRLDSACELVNLRAVALGAPGLDEPPPAPPATGPVEAAIVGTQRIHHRGAWHDAALVDRALLGPGHRLVGPAVVTQTDSTTLVLPGHVAEVDAHLNLVIGPAAAEAPEQRAESPIVIDIVENALKNIRREMDAVIFRAAMSTVIREEHDSFPLLADDQGRMLAGQFGWPLGEFFERWPKEDVRPGDVLLMNDPYLLGGALQHTPDMLLLRPIFVGEELVGFASQIGNLMDIGGAVPGSMPARSRSIFEEGIRFPPVKLYDRGVLQQPIVDILARNSRTPELTVADTLALAAATRAAELRVVELCERIGVETYRRVCQALLDRTRRAAGLMIDTFLPEEPLVFEDVVDDDGCGNGPFRIRLALCRRDGKAVLDFSGTSPQAEGPINLYMGRNMFAMVTGIVLIMALDPQILFNHGYQDLFEIDFPQGSVIQPEFPAPLSNRSHTLARIFDVLSGVLAQQNPQLATGAACGSSPHFLLSGRDEDGAFFLFYEINYGGIPGRPVGDGMDVHAWWPHVTSIPVEYAEAYFPLRVLSLRGAPDSGGAGRHRGGNGVEKVYEFLVPGEVSIHDDRAVSRPWGIGGGLAAAGSRKVLLRRDGTEEELPSKLDFLRVEPGDRLLYVTAGGGGWGDPLTRDPEAVRLDVLRGFATAEHARSTYGVAVEGDGASVDLAATEALRAALARGRPEPLPVFDFGPGGPP